MKRKLLIILLLTIILYSPTALATAESKTSDTINIKIGNKDFLLTKASTPFARRQGLMHRKHLDDNKGMIFIYDYPDISTFWMGHTLIPLDLIMIKPNGTISDIFLLEPQEQKKPNETEEQYSERMPRYTSSERILYAIEIKQGNVKKLNIKKGDHIVIPSNIYKPS